MRYRPPTTSPTLTGDCDNQFAMLRLASSMSKGARPRLPGPLLTRSPRPVMGTSHAARESSSSMTSTPFRQSGRASGMLWAALVLAVDCFGCSGDDSPPNQPASALTTGSKCPDPASPSVTYRSWAQGFFESYCTRCHSSTLVTNSERSGATPHANWDDLPTIKAYASEIDADAAGGPNGINRVMPPSDPRPSDDDRSKLGEWLACGAPE